MSRAQLSHPLNWILILFAGAIFLLFFITTTKSILSTNEDVANLELQNALRSTIENSKTQPNTFFETTLPLLETRCEVGRPFSVAYGGQEISLPFQAIFSPTKLLGKTTVLSKEFVISSPVLSISYLFSRESLLVLLETPSDPFPREIKDLVAPFPHRILSPGELSSMSTSGFSSVHILTKEPPLVATIPAVANQEVFIIRIDTSTQPAQRGGLTFYSLDQQNLAQENSAPIAYVGEELLLGAIISGSLEKYSCNKQLMQNKIRFIIELQKERTQQLASITPMPQICALAYNSALTTYDAILAQPSLLESSSQLSTFETTLQTASRNLQSAGCPNIQ